MSYLLLNKAAKYALIYVFFYYWITPFYLLIDFIFFNSSKVENVQSFYGEVIYIPLYIIFWTLFVSCLYISTRAKSKIIKKNKPILRRILIPKIDNLVALIIISLSIYCSIYGYSNFRYDEFFELGSAGIATKLKSILYFILISIWFLRSTLFHSSLKKLAWKFNTLIYFISTVLLSSGLGTVLFSSVWIHQLLTNEDEKGLSLLNNLQKSFKSLFISNPRIKKNILFLTIAIFTLIPTFSLSIIQYGHSKKINNISFDSVNSNFGTFSYYVNTYLLKTGFNRPEFFTVYKSPTIEYLDLSENKKQFLQNLTYRFEIIFGNEIYDSGKSPGRINIEKISEYEISSKEGTSPGLLKSFAYFFSEPISTIFEILYGFMIFILIASFNSKDVYINNFLHTYFLLSTLLNDPLSTITGLNETFVLLFIIIIYRINLKNFSKKLIIEK